ncbi:hypothetical protein NL676_005976 [Syzygium grande]|nr:hypothetical protein NL676_005976 [Syzygium grande]
MTMGEKEDRGGGLLRGIHGEGRLTPPSPRGGVSLAGGGDGVSGVDRYVERGHRRSRSHAPEEDSSSRSSPPTLVPARSGSRNLRPGLPDPVLESTGCRPGARVTIERCLGKWPGCSPRRPFVRKFDRISVEMHRSVRK